jgi:ribonuclease BN (tRNA processing enzyme)
MKLILLGTTGYHPNDRRQTACIMFPELGVVFDAGSAMYRVSEYLLSDTLDIFLTHAHLDHVVGLTYLFDVLQQHPLQQVRVHGEVDKLSAIREHLFADFLFPVEPPFEMQILKPEVVLADEAVLTHFPLRHPGGSVGYRIDWPDRSLAYVTDTVAAADADYVEKIKGVDLLLHECYFGDDMPDQAELTGHSCLTPVAEVAAQAEVGRMVLVHINPLLNSDAALNVEKAQTIFPHIEIGVDRMELEC